MVYHGGNLLFLSEIRCLCLRYFHPIALLEISPDHLLNNRTYFAVTGSKRVRLWKLNMAAYIVFMLCQGNTFTLTDDASLNSFKTIDPEKYWCFIVPVVHTMVVVMDNERKTTLSARNILNFKVKSFRTRMKADIQEHGVWSEERILGDPAFQSVPQHIGRTMTRGVHHTVARIFHLLTPEAGLDGLGDHMTWLTNEQRTVLLENFDPVHLIRRHDGALG